MCFGFACDKISDRFWLSSQGAIREERAKCSCRSRRTPAEDAQKSAGRATGSLVRLSLGELQPLAAQKGGVEWVPPTSTTSKRGKKAGKQKGRRVESGKTSEGQPQRKAQKQAKPRSNKQNVSSQKEAERRTKRQSRGHAQANALPEILPEATHHLKILPWPSH